MWHGKDKDKETCTGCPNIVSTYKIGTVASRRMPCSLIALSPTAMVRRAALSFMGPDLRHTIPDLVEAPLRWPDQTVVLLEMHGWA